MVKGESSDTGRNDGVAKGERDARESFQFSPLCLY